MRLTIIQSALTWESPSANREMFARKFAGLRGQTDLVVLPEMFTTGFSMNPKALAEPMEGQTTAWLRKQAEIMNAAISGSFICVENGRYFNRLVFARPDGALEYYDKRHLFTLAGEHEHYAAGNKQLVVDWLGWRIKPLICYDLRFPVWSRNSTPRGKDGQGGKPLGATYDLLLYVANWPARRSHHWRSLLTARAIENQSFVAGVNIVGKDGNDFEYSGDSTVIDFSGQPIVGISGKEGVFTAELSLDDMEQYRRQLPFLADGDTFQLS